MPLIDLWKSNPTAIGEMTIEQIVATAGDGSLKDTSKCSEELRGYFSRIESPKLASYLEHCLTIAFAKSGLVLQDIVNELGRRLDYVVENGRYQGVVGKIGFDGIWRSSEFQTVVVEVKTTDAYRISLDTIADYRRKLTTADRIDEDASVLIVVGRQDTGELEAQVRGSRHAWDIRIISADALVKLVQLKENSEGGATGAKIRALLRPMEYTRLDDMVDMMFTTATEVENAASEERAVIEEPDSSDDQQLQEKVKGVWQFTDSDLLQEKRKEIVKAVGKMLSTDLISKTRATLWSSDRATRAAITLSKRYVKKAYPYWYAYHPQWDDFLAQGVNSFLVLGCMDLPVAFCIPRDVLVKYLDNFNVTKNEDRMYWHLHIVEEPSEKFSLLLSRSDKNLDLTTFKLPIG